MRVALVYDRVNKFGGAERVLQALHEIWPTAPLFTSVYNKKSAPWAKNLVVYPSFLQRIPFFRGSHEAIGWLMPKAFESLDLTGYDVVISVTSEAAKSVKTASGQLHICYLLTPTRYLWSDTTMYLKMIPGVLRPLAFLVMTNLRVWDYWAAQGPKHVISISEHVRKRCEKYYRRKSKVIYPPTAIESSGSCRSLLPPDVLDSATDGRRGSPTRTTPRVNCLQRDYFLVVSRLVRYKRIDLAIEVCNRMKVPLMIVGCGKDEQRLRRLAGETISFAGQVSDEELGEYYRGARALLMPQEEELGLAALEAQASGRPVIAFRRSGASEIIIESETGLLFDQQKPEALEIVMKKMDNVVLSEKKCRENARRFSKEKFKKEFEGEVKKLWQRKQKTTCSQ